MLVRVCLTCTRLAKTKIISLNHNTTASTTNLDPAALLALSKLLKGEYMQRDNKHKVYFRNMLRPENFGCMCSVSVLWPAVQRSRSGLNDARLCGANMEALTPPSQRSNLSIRLLKLKDVALWHNYSQTYTQMFAFLQRKALSHAGKLSGWCSRRHYYHHYYSNRGSMWAP